ncbi:hypothetical protein BDF20DRAFT_854990 [Mycotypha africana]|uniref:uncharacterized protein n=1 Tax=Mycotypha africana TaxID=64632 RepID=UPI0023009D37|nr:uncharacterized protein BDF20DRAFT_854990 [Mycotypha africana]KAI8988301.1 hypothetical protein BDF20DRAFT_854990 [Mycotypha africana]
MTQKSTNSSSQDKFKHSQQQQQQQQQQHHQQQPTTRQQRQQQHQRNQNGLPVSIHPDDAKDKVFTAILKALLKMGNKPSSPKELANIIVKYKYATLGGATPFATVSSRISQHFKRAAEHNPPRPPLLAKHVDQNHSRKINYSLATTSTTTPANDTTDSSTDTGKSAISPEAHDNNNTADAAASYTSTNASLPTPNIKSSLRNARKDKLRQQPSQSSNTSLQHHRGKRSKMSSDDICSGDESTDEEGDDSITENRTIHHASKKHKTSHQYPYRSPPQLLVNHGSDIGEVEDEEDDEEIMSNFHTSVVKEEDESEESEGEHSDYHEEMLKSDDLNLLTTQPLKNIRRPSYLKLSTNHTSSKGSLGSNDAPSISAVVTNAPTTAATATGMSSVPSHLSPANKAGLLPQPLESITAARKPSFSLGDQEFWTPFSFEHDFDNVFLNHDTATSATNNTGATTAAITTIPPSSNTSHSATLNPIINPTVPFNIATPESISVSELETYFANTPSPSSSSSTSSQIGNTPSLAKQSNSHNHTINRSPLSKDASKAQSNTKDDNKFNKSKRKSFSSTMLGPHDKSLLQKVLLTSAARGVADKIDEEAEEDEIKETKRRCDEEKAEEVDHQQMEGKSTVSKENETLINVNNDSSPSTAEQEKQKPTTAVMKEKEKVSSPQPTASVINSSSSINVTNMTNGEDFVKFEDDEKKEEAVTAPSTPTISSSLHPPSTTSANKTPLPINSTTTKSPAPILPAPVTTASPVKKMADILPAATPNATAAMSSVANTNTNTNTNASTLAAAELFKNNLSAIHQLTSSIPSLQYLTPTLDLAKVMAIYMQTLAKTANASNAALSSTSSSSASGTVPQQQANNYAMDLKSILARFPALEAFLKKDPATSTASSSATVTTAVATSAATTATPFISAAVAPSGLSTPPLVSPTTTDFSHQTTTSTTAPSTPTTPTFTVTTAPQMTSNVSSTTTAGGSTNTHHSSSASAASTSSTAATTTMNNPSVTATTEPVIQPLTPTNPPMYITVVDHIAVCVVVLPKTDTTPEYRIMRRIDTNFINGTVLLTAGGIETESERSMILSFEMERIRMPRKKSILFGTWIPLRRAQELAVTCSIQHKLGHFLDDRIDTLFPSPLPLPLPPHHHHHSTHALLKNKRGVVDHRWTALALAALKETSANAAAVAGNGGLVTAKRQPFVVPPISRQSSSSGSMVSAQLQELLMAHPHKALKSNGKTFINDPTISGPASPTTPAATTSASLLMGTSKPLKGLSKGKKKEKKALSKAGEKDDSSDVDIVNTSDSSPTLSSDELSDVESTTATATTNTATKNATDVASIANVPTSSASASLLKNSKLLQLEELLSRVAASKQQQPLHVHPRDLQKKRRRDSIGSSPAVSRSLKDDESDILQKKSNQSNGAKSTKSSEHSRKRANTGSQSSNGSGKWSASTASSKRSSAGGSSSTSSGGTTITIKRSASTTNGKKGGSKSKQQQQQQQTSAQHQKKTAVDIVDKVENERLVNKTIVENPKSSAIPSTTNTNTFTSTNNISKTTNNITQHAIKNNSNNSAMTVSSSAVHSATITGGTTIKLEHNEEDEEDDEDIDIGGSDCDDDLR